MIFKHVLNISILLLFLSYFKCCVCKLKSRKSEDELLSVFAVMRHGSRNIIKPYPYDPYYESEKYWPEGFGQLDSEGKESHYILGKWLRSKYEKFLTDTYSIKNIYVRSTDIDRTIMSALSTLAGMYPPKKNQMWDKETRWQPIPVHTTPRVEDTLIMTDRPCPKYQRLLNDLVHNSPYYAKVNKDYEDIYQYIEIHTGTKISSFMDINTPHDDLYIQNRRNMVLPAWAESVFPEPMETMALAQFTVQVATPEISALRVGPLVNYLVEGFSKVNSSKKTFDRNTWNGKFILISAHDSTVIPILTVMGVFNEKMVPYSSIVLFELRKTLKGMKYVNILYRNGTTLKDAHKMVMPGCEFNCPFEKFVNYLEPVNLPSTDWDSACAK